MIKKEEDDNQIDNKEEDKNVKLSTDILLSSTDLVESNVNINNKVKEKKTKILSSIKINYKK